MHSHTSCITQAAKEALPSSPSLGPAENPHRACASNSAAICRRAHAPLSHAPCSLAIEQHHACELSAHNAASTVYPMRNGARRTRCCQHHRSHAYMHALKTKYMAWPQASARTDVQGQLAASQGKYGAADHVMLGLPVTAVCNTNRAQRPAAASQQVLPPRAACR